MNSDEKSIVIIHGNEWDWRHISDNIEARRGREWVRETWKARKHGDTHDHCQICWWTLFESDNEMEGVGYTDGHGSTSLECFERFLAQ